MIYGNINASNVNRDNKKTAKSSEGKTYVFAGYSGSTVSLNISNVNYKVLSSLSFVWRDDTLPEQYNTDGYRGAILMAGIWWFVLFYFPARYVHKRPGMLYIDRICRIFSISHTILCYIPHISSHYIYHTLHLILMFDAAYHCNMKYCLILILYHTT